METLFEDWSAFLRLLTRHRVRFLLIGGHAVSLHARPRHTEDLDLFVEATKANGARVLAALAEFGFASVAPPLELLSRPQKVFMLGRRPYRIDLLTKIDGVSFREAWRGRVVVDLAGLAIPVIGEGALRKNKLASGRPKDLADLALLDEAAGAPVSSSLVTRSGTRPRRGAPRSSR
ncbi:MAG: hypothetical protein IPM79_35380 [Polyangiaceae bacterium]|jgi:hypothetical protein|nr:hypothetical protein [Polyangiaceae bacterium]MBK8942740.1 hypothetical protein [Polyangiaceae bacterium]